MAAGVKFPWTGVIDLLLIGLSPSLMDFGMSSDDHGGNSRAGSAFFWMMCAQWHLLELCYAVRWMLRLFVR